MKQWHDNVARVKMRQWIKMEISTITEQNNLKTSETRLNGLKDQLKGQKQ